MNLVYIDVEDLERRLRQQFAAMEAGISHEPQGAVFMRAQESLIQFNLWIAREINYATKPSLVMSAAAALMTNMIVNLGNQVMREDESAVVAIIENILDNIENFDEMLLVGQAVEVPIIRGGTA